MSDLPEETLKLELSDDIFKGIKFFICGEVHEKVIDLLKCGGAERLNYFTDYVTHLIVGNNPEESDISDANDVYEIPALTPKWIIMCARLKRLVSTKPYLYVLGGKLLANLVFCFSNIREDRKYLWSLITYNGGTVQLNLTIKCNYLVTTDTSGAKYEKAENLGSERIKIVTPDWIVETVKNKSLADTVLFHPKLINWPKPVKHESTTAITGFEPEHADENEKNEEKGVSDSTQALLEKLKQRMPWNQPSIPKTTSSDPIAPPNVVAPSFTQKGQGHQPPRAHMNVPPQSLPITPQSPVSSNFPQVPRSPSSLSNQHIPRSIVHHTPSQGGFQDQQNPLNIGRLINQSQARPGIQQLRGQLGQNQLHQQLLQQRMQQNQQNIIQRTSTGQITVQQQLLQQQFVQRQIQNQLNQRQGSNQQTIGQNPVVGQNQQQIGQNQHMGQLSQQQVAQLQQQQLLKQNQQQLQQQLHIGQNQQQQIPLSQNQQLLQNQVMQQQNQLNQQQNQLTQQQNVMNQQQNTLNQQQNSVNQQQNQINQQQQGQVNQQQNQLQQQQQIQMGQGQNFMQQSINQNQQSLQQKPQFLNQQQTVTSQQQIIQNQTNLSVQQFVNQGFNQSQNTNQELNLQNIQQQPVSQQQQNINQQLNAQVLNQQLSSQNLGQQLNQQQLNQQMNQQQSQINQQLVQQNQLLNQQLNQQTPMGQPLNPPPDQMSQQLNSQNQLNQLSQQQSLNQQSLEQGLTQNINQTLNHQLNQGISQHLQQQQNLQQQQLNRQNLQQQQQQQLNNQQMQAQQQQQSLNQQQQQIPQINQQLNSPLPQVVRAQFQQQANVNQQILINQQSPQNTSPQRAQINQHLWAQQPSQVPAQQIIRHSVNVVQQQNPRVQWSPNAQQANVVPQRQFIHLDARTHNELQKMPPEQQALFVAKLQRQRQLLKQRGGGGSHILIRGNVPPGLTTQQQFQWLQQQAKQQGIVLPPNIQQQNITPGTLTQPGLAQNIQHAPGLSPINQNNLQFAEQSPQQQLQLRQYRLQQLQLQREQAQKNHLAQQQQAPIQQPTIVRPIGQPQLADSTTNPPPVPEASIQHPLVVNAKTKTALANMLSIKLQSGGSSMGVQRAEALPEPSASGTLRLMTAQHNAALNSKPQEIIALQRRTISGPNGEIIKPPGAPPLPITPTNDPPKLQYCPKPALPLQHRPGPFYGHNPNLKLPPDLFLLGCIFVVVELESFLEKRIPGWQQKIEKHGGEVEKQYCNRVTHVLCETQRHGVVMQALRDCKRCVTIVWLSDVMARKQVLPPWTALHLPNIYLDTAPASKHLISISGFEGSDRNRVKHMIQYTGAKCTTYFSKHNTLLIAAKAEGKKCTYAKKWQIPIVNVQWLTDVMLGNFTAMNQMEHQIYQQFSNPPNFSFDPKLVPNLMHAWKAPINISQESYERVKRSASPVALPKKSKKQKTEPTDENDNISDDHVTNSTHRILFSMFDDAKPLQKMVRDLGGSVAKDHTNFTHLVMPHLARSHKLFFAIAKGALVLSEQWLRDSHAANQFLPETNYNLNSKDFNYEYKCDIDQTFLTRNRNRLFEGKFFFVTPSVIPSKRIVTELIQCCGGVVERIRRSSAQIEATSVNSPYSYFIVTHENDLHLVADLLKNKKDKMKIVCNVELVFSAVLKQTFEVEPYAVCVL